MREKAKKPDSDDEDVQPVETTRKITGTSSVGSSGRPDTPTSKQSGQQKYGDKYLGNELYNQLLDS